MVVCDWPVLMLTEPLTGDAKVFSAQVVSDGSAGFGIGSGVPKLHPVLLQSGAVLLSGGAAEVGPTLQSEPEQLLLQAPPPAAQVSVNRLVEPSGVEDSPTRELPPPMSRPPQPRFLMTVPLEFIVVPQTPPGTAVLNWRNAPPTD